VLIKGRSALRNPSNRWAAFAMVASYRRRRDQPFPDAAGSFSTGTLAWPRERQGHALRRLQMQRAPVAGLAAKDRRTHDNRFEIVA